MSRWVRYGAAAALVALLGAGGWLGTVRAGEAPEVDAASAGKIPGYKEIGTNQLSFQTRPPAGTPQPGEVEGAITDDEANSILCFSVPREPGETRAKWTIRVTGGVGGGYVAEFHLPWNSYRGDYYGCSIDGAGSTTFLLVASMFGEAPTHVELYDEHSRVTKYYAEFDRLHTYDGPETEVYDSPVRVYDSRAESAGMLAPGETRTVQLPLPLRARAAHITVTVDQTVGSGYLTLYAADVPLPETSNVNWTASGQTIAASAVVNVDDRGWINITNGPNETQFIIDLSGHVN